MLDAIASFAASEFGWLTLGLLIGGSIGSCIATLAMASVRLGARYDRETENMLDDAGYYDRRIYDDAHVVIREPGKVVYDFRGSGR